MIRETRTGLRGAPLAALAILVAAPLVGQEGVPLEDPADRPVDRQCICVDDMRDIREIVRAAPFHAFTTARRARLGVMLGDPVEVGDRMGVRLQDVPEGTPAHRAGLRQGDVLVALDGRELAPEPTSTLLRLLGDVEPGDTVQLTFSRDGSDRTARVVTEPTPDFGGMRDFGGLEGARLRLRAPIPPPGPDAPRLFRRDGELQPVGARSGLLYRGRIGGLDLAAVNTELGEYFGTDRGVLVTAIESDSPLGLRAGDVILAIGGRDVRDPAHVRAILASFRDDEEIDFRIIRERRTREVTGRLP